ncbi:hypothetical protein DRJ17_02600 [Candidatus Woesearchaeota archaeon]|nr:MAG: hypothetical protein DRJ17_02600 [Candidatus Woesearchaeota archaeon]
MTNIELLEEVGLTLREIKVYTALLELGLSPVGPIIKKSGIPSSKIYETLNKLIRRGLASYIIKQNKKHFCASEPRTILDFLEEKKKKIKEEIIPKLELLQKFAVREEEATVYEGIKGIKSIYERMVKLLEKNEDILVMGAPASVQEKIELYLQNWNKRRIKKGIRLKIIYLPAAKKYGKIREKMKFTEVRYLSETITAPAWIDIFQDFVVTFDFSREIPIAFLIKSRAISKSYRNYFELIWRQCK